MSDANALAEIQRLAQIHSIRYTGHARSRMRRRGAEPADVRNGLLTATSASWQADEGSWRVTGGVDCEGDELTVCVAVEADVIVVTIF